MTPPILMTTYTVACRVPWYPASRENERDIGPPNHGAGLVSTQGAVQTVSWHTGQARQNGCKVRQLRKAACVFAELR